MFRSNILLLARLFFRKERLVFFMSTIGTAICVASLTLLIRYVDFEENYDTFFPEYKNTYRVYQDITNTGSGQTEKMAMIPGKITEQVRYSIPDVKSISWLSPKLSSTVKDIEKKEVYYIENGFMADPALFSVFPLPFVYGNRDLALKSNLSVVISLSVSKRIFGNENPLNRHIKLSWGSFEDIYTVKGVFKDLPKNSHLAIDLIYTNADMARQQEDWNYHYTYVLLNKSANPDIVRSETQKIFDQAYKAVLAERKEKAAISFMKISDIHLKSGFERDFKEAGDYKVFFLIKILSIVSLLIFIINYVNLSAALYIKRIKEIHLRSTLGASVKDFATQILLENGLQLFIGVILSVVLLLIAIPYYAGIVQIPADYTFLLSSKYLFTLACLVVTIAALATIFPLILFIRSAKAAKRIRKNGPFDARNLLLGIQYVLVGSIIFAMLIIKSQVNYMHKKDLGFQKERVIFMLCPPLRMLDNEKLERIRLFCDEIKTIPGVENISNSLTIPGRFYNNMSTFSRQTTSEVNCMGYMANVDYNFLDTYKLKLLAGRNFYKKFNDDIGIIINETLLKNLHFRNPEEAIGKEIKLNDKAYTVIGVIGDNHQNSFKNNIKPWALVMVFKATSFLSIKLGERYTGKTIERIKTEYMRMFPEAGFEYKYLDQFFDRLFRQDDILKNSFIIFSFIMMILIAIGLFGISSFIISQRVREIAIRKVMGAGLMQNIQLIFKDYLVVILGSTVVSLGLSFYCMKIWLESFAYKVEIKLYLFIIPLLIILLVTFCIVLYNVIKVEMSNPARSLNVT